MKFRNDLKQTEREELNRLIYIKRDIEDSLQVLKKCNTLKKLIDFIENDCLVELDINYKEFTEDEFEENYNLVECYLNIELEKINDDLILYTDDE